MTDTKDKLKNTLKYALKDLEDYKGKWYILWFLKSGQTFRGCFTYDTEDEAMKAGDDFLKRAKSGEFPTFRSMTRMSISCSELSYFVPMPLGEN